MVFSPEEEDNELIHKLFASCNVRGNESVEVPVVPPDLRIKPKILDPVYEDDPLLYIINQVEGGMITLLSRMPGQAEEELGSRPSSEFPEVSAPPLQVQQVLRVMQELCGFKEFSAPIQVQKRPVKIDPPVIRKPLYSCGEIVAVDNVKVYVSQTPPNHTSPEYPISNARATESVLGTFKTPDK